MALISNNAEGGTTGTTVTTGNSGAESGTAAASVLINAGNAITFDTAAAHRGGLGYKFDMGTTQPCQLTWTLATTIRTVMRFYFMATALPSANDYVAVYRNATLGPATLTLTTANKFNVQNAAGAGISASTATNAIVANTWYRVELAITKGTTTSNGRIEYAYYIGDSTTAEFSYDSGTTVNAGTTDIASIRLGRNTAGTVAGIRYYDDLVARDLASGWIGPPSDAVAPSGIASGETFGSAALTIPRTVSPSGIASAEAFGTAVVTTASTRGIALVSETEYHTASANPFACSPVTAATGDTLVALVHLRTGAVSNTTTLSDGSGNVWTQRATDFLSGVNSRILIFTAPVTSALSAGTVTVTTSAAYAATVSITRWSGVGSVDVAASINEAATTTPAGAPVATTDNGDVVIGGISYGSATAPTSLAAGWSTLTGNSPNTGYYGANAYRHPGATGSFAPAWVIPSAGSASATVALKPVAAALTISLSGIASTETFGTATVATPLTVTPAGASSAEAFGTAGITTTLTVSPSGVTSAQAFGTAVVGNSGPAPVTVSPTGIASATAFGTAAITYLTTVSPAGIASGEALGTPVLTTALTVFPSGGSSTETFGTATVTNLPPATSITPTGIASAAAFGTAAISTFLQIGPPGGVGTQEAFGHPAVTGRLTASPAGIASAQAFGELTVSQQLTVNPAGIAGLEQFGTASVSLPDPILTPPGIASAEAFGTPALSGHLSGPFVLLTSIPPARYLGDLPPQTERSTTATRWEGSLG
jgi:hypothetical protein